MTRAFIVAAVSFGLLLAAFSADTPPSEVWSGPVYEYAIVRWAGDRTSILWPDGTVQKVIAFGGKKRPETEDERTWYLTGALNIMGRRGFEPVHISNDEVVGRRTATK